MADVIKASTADKGQNQDAIWQRQQIKSFTAWVNSHLMKAGLKVTDLGTDFQDGKHLIKLVEIIAGETLPRPEKGKMKLHKIQNLNKALDHIASKGVKLIGISAEEIHDGNLKMILGMIWILILKFQINDISVEEMSARDGLLLWCQKKTAGYNGCNVQNFHTSWQNGNAFCALIHRHRPDLLDYATLPDNPRDKLNLAFKVAEDSLGIPQMLDADDMIAAVKPDERSVMTYVAMYYHCFAGSNRAEEAARRLETVLQLQQQISQMIQDYESRASDLLAWIAEKDNWLSDTTPIQSMEILKEAMQNFSNYKSSEKPPKSKEKIDLESHYSSLQTLLRVNNRPAYHPQEGMLVSDIQSAWKGLSKNEKTRTQFLHDEKDRLQKLERLARRFGTKAKIHTKWAGGKGDTANSDNLGEDVGTVMQLIKQHEALKSDVSAHAARVKDLRKIAGELRDGNYEGADDIESQCSTIEADWETLNAAVDGREQKLQDALAHQQKLDEMRLEFAKKAAAFQSWCEQQQEDLLDDVHTKNMEEVAQQKDDFNALKGTIEGHSSEFDGLCTLSNEMEEAGITKNDYTNATKESLEGVWNEVCSLLNTREENINNESNRQEECESLRVQFAEAANGLGDKMKEMSDKMSASSSAGLSEQLDTLKTYSEEVAALKPELDSCSEINQRVTAASIYSNSHAEYTMSDLNDLNDQLNSIVTKNTTTVENQILMRDQSGVTEEQMKEYRESFDHFDKNKSGYLDKNEFRSAALAVSYDLGEGDTKLNAVWEECVKGDDGFSFEAFVDLLTKDKGDSNSITQFLENFKTLAGDKEYITEAEIRRDLSPATADYVVANMKPFEGVEDGLDYKSFSASLFG